MTQFLLGAAAFVLGTVAFGLVRILRGPGEADRMLAAQLLGTGGVAALLLFGVASGVPAIAGIALVLALLAAFASAAFVAGAGQGTVRPRETPGAGTDPTGRDLA